jgi:hypothetical protein
MEKTKSASKNSVKGTVKNTLVQLMEDYIAYCEKYHIYKIY